MFSSPLCNVGRGMGGLFGSLLADLVATPLKKELPPADQVACNGLRNAEIRRTTTETVLRQYMPAEGSQRKSPRAQQSLDVSCPWCPFRNVYLAHPPSERMFFSGRTPSIQIATKGRSKNLVATSTMLQFQPPIPAQGCLNFASQVRRIPSYQLGTERPWQVGSMNRYCVRLKSSILTLLNSTAPARHNQTARVDGNRVWRLWVAVQAWATDLPLSFRVTPSDDQLFARLFSATDRRRCADAARSMAVVCRYVKVIRKILAQVATWLVAVHPHCGFNGAGKVRATAMAAGMGDLGWCVSQSETCSHHGRCLDGGASASPAEPGDELGSS